jgi:hypothetical protein
MVFTVREAVLFLRNFKGRSWYVAMYHGVIKAQTQATDMLRVCSTQHLSSPACEIDPCCYLLLSQVFNCPIAGQETRYEPDGIGRHGRVEGVMCFHQLLAKILQKHLMALTLEAMSTSYMTSIIDLL